MEFLTCSFLTVLSSLSHALCLGPLKPKKKKRPANSHSNPAAEKKQKIKLEPLEASSHHDPKLGSMNDKDKEALDRWKRFQKASQVGRNGCEEDMEKMVFMQQQQLMRRQIEEQGHVIANQQKIIHEQHEYIMVLKEQRQTLIRECRQAGLTIPDLTTLRTPNFPKQQSLSGTSSQHFTLPPPSHTSCIPFPSQTPPPPAGHPLSQPPPPSPAQSLSTSMPKPHPPPSYPLPPPPPILPHHHHGHQSVSNLLPPPPPPPHGPVLCSQQYSHSGLSSQPQCTQLTSSAAHISTHIPHHATQSTQRTLSLVEGLTFSPLTSSEFRDIEHKDQPPGYSSLVMRSYDEELNNILDIAGLPTGSGAGYGVGVADDELPALDLRFVLL